MSQDPLRYFRIEARELVDQISAGVLDLDQRPGPDLVARLLRFAHTLKGAARVVRQQDIADRAHAFEEVLVPHRDGAAPLPADEIRELLRLNDEIDAHLHALGPGPAGSGHAGPGSAGSGPVGSGPVGSGPVGASGSASVVESPSPGGDRHGAPRTTRSIGPNAAPAAAAPATRTTNAGAPAAGRHATATGDTRRTGTPGGPESRPDASAGSAPAPTSVSPESPYDGPTSPYDGPVDAGSADHGISKDETAGHGADDAGTVDSGSEPGEGAPAGSTPTRSATPAATRVPHPEHAPVVGGAAESSHGGRTPAGDVDELLDAVGEAHARFAPLRSATRALAGLHRSADALAGRLRTGARPGDQVTSAAGRAAAIRLADDIGALGRRLSDAAEQVERELDEIRGRAERLRLVAAASIFTALHRAVRDAADAEGKRVVFDGRGGDLRMDPQVLAQAGNAMLHVVRNAVVHGIEDAAGRAAAGKPAEGHITVTVERRGRYAAFRCRDDGRGFDLDAVRRTAEQRGLLTPGGPAPDQQRLLDLLLRGGISTTTTVTEVSGRGIGLDVARDVAEHLGGTVTVRTDTGVGATVEVVLPLSLLSVHGLVVEAGNVVATVPLDAVRTCVRLQPAVAMSATADGRLAHDGRAVPYLPLRRVLGPRIVGEAPAGTSSTAAGASVAVLVVADDDVVAVGVDRLAGTSTLVVRPLPDLAPATPVVGGISIDLDGNPRLVLDAPGLVAEALHYNGAGGEPTAQRTTRHPILVVDDSLTTRMLERSILESAGYEVDLAASGEEGLDKARLRQYSLFLTDIDMPGIDGFTFVERTRADPELSAIPAILVSSRSSAEDRQRGVAVGADAYVVKGEFDQEELLAHIRKLVPA